MFKQYRRIEQGEFFCVVGDTSQGGADFNCTQFLSVTRLDIPLVYHGHGVAAGMTAALFPVLEELHDLTGYAPMVCLERNNGGASEMDRLLALNRLRKYNLFVMPKIGVLPGEDEAAGLTKKLGFDTTAETRRMVLGDWKQAIQARAIRIYDETTIDEHFHFIVNSQGKPEAAPRKHDDCVMSCAIAYYVYQVTPRPLPPVSDRELAASLPREQMFDKGGFY